MCVALKNRSSSLLSEAIVNGGYGFRDTYVTVATSIAELDLRMNIPRRLIVKPLTTLLSSVLALQTIPKLPQHPSDPNLLPPPIPHL